MVVRVLLGCVVVCALGVSTLAEGPKKVDEPAGLLEVETIALVRVNDRLVSFNQGRQYAISINEHLPDAKTSRAKLAGVLNKQKQLDQVVFEWFGQAVPKRLNLTIGDEIPVETAQAVIEAYAVEAKVPVYIALMTKDERLGHKRCVCVGGLRNCGKEPLAPKQIEELIKPGLTRERFADLVTMFGD